MSLENQVARVSQGTKDTLKTLINKLGGNVTDELIDQYPTIASALNKVDPAGSAQQALSDAKEYTDQKISEIPTPDVSGQINTHNVDTGAHADIRSAITSHTSDTTVHITADERTAWNSKASGTHASQHASSGDDPITPASIGALPTSGGTMTGDLVINSNEELAFKTLIGATQEYVAGANFKYKITTDSLGTELIDGAETVTVLSNLNELIIGVAGATNKGLVKITAPGGDKVPGLHMNRRRIGVVGEPIFLDDAATKRYVDNAVSEKSDMPTSTSIILSASGWDSTALTQTVTVTGISANEADQLIIPTPALASQAAYYEAGILCTAQAVDSLTFTCTTVPTEDLTVYVVIQEVTQG